jgi:hypothetical protein
MKFAANGNNFDLEFFFGNVLKRCFQQVFSSSSSSSSTTTTRTKTMQTRNNMLMYR